MAKPVQQIRPGDTISGRGVVVFVRRMGGLVHVRFTDGSNKLYRVSTRV